ncbi:MAG TPA: DNA recombination/repair protein RecA, partial [Armatimonadetes bacterium]|nr:DNA recombination/repair protein RecA [Armatimonadota bacterium]
KVVKNKVAPPFRQAEFDIMFGKGISKSGGILDMGTEMGMVSKMGTWFAYGDTRLGQGRENAKQFLEEHAELMEEIEARIRAEGIAILPADKASATEE